MKHIIDSSHDVARDHFLKGSSYFNGDFPEYIDFSRILNDVSNALGQNKLSDFCKNKPETFDGVNYQFTANKDGRFSWRPYELIHPAIYVYLANIICDPDNWKYIVERVKSFENNFVVSCGSPVISDDHLSDKATQIQNWWQIVEQDSIKYSLEFSHLIHTDVTDCYGSLYTHSIAWALHGIDTAKNGKFDKNLLGNQIDNLIQSSRYGQTNGIPQGSILMDFIAEIVLGWIDDQIYKSISNIEDYRILRYRDDYRIFAKSDVDAEFILKTISDTLRKIGMKLSVQKTVISSNVIEGAIKPDKLAAINLQDLGSINARTMQKKLLRLHKFGRQFPNSGALRRLLSEYYSDIIKINKKPKDLEVQVAIITDLGIISPQSFPAIAGILSHLISLAGKKNKNKLWNKVKKKIERVPNNGYLEIWLQRVTKPKSVGINFETDEPICKIVDGQNENLWRNDWISSKELKKASDPKNILVKDPEKSPEIVSPKEIELFAKNAKYY